MVFDMANMFRTELSEHQKKAFEWLLDRETTNDLPPFWDQAEDSFVNLPTNSKSETRPKPLRGGIFNDEKGLGMILPLLYLIASDKKDSVKPKPTLVVTTRIYRGWRRHLQNDTVPGALKVHIHHPGTEDAEELLNTCDLVLTDYFCLRGKGSTTIKKLEWWRVILTEVDSSLALANTALPIALNAPRRWAVTEKTIENKLVCFLLAFLRLEPFSTNMDLVQCLGTNHLKVLLEAISLQRTKVTLGLLPPKIEETHYIELSFEERKQYVEVKKEAEETLQHYNNNRDQTLLPCLESLIVSLRQICTDSNLCSPHFKLRDFEDVSKKPDLMQKFVRVLQEDDPDCPICIAPPKDPLITCCGHIFCRKCIRKVVKRDKLECPVCRHKLSKTDLFSAPSESSSDGCESSKVELLARRLSTKVDVLIKLLTESKCENPAVKSIVFSQFPRMLSSMEGPLTDAGFNTMCLYREMNALDKARVMEKFQALDEDRPMVLLVGITATREKLDLRAASRVYLMEASKKAVEEQAVQCVYHTGQKEPVKVVRLIAKNSIEEKILVLHEKKMNPVGFLGSFGSERVSWCPDRIGLNEAYSILKE